MEGYYYARKKKEVNGEVLLEVPMIVEPNMVQLDGSRICRVRIAVWYMPCVYVWIPESYYLFHKRDLEQQVKACVRSHRCLIPEPGKPGSRIRCPECNCCSTCPARLRADFDNGGDCSLDGLMEVSTLILENGGYGEPSEFTSSEQDPGELAVSVDSLRQLNETLDLIAAMLEEKKPKYALIFDQLRAGETNASEIARRCGLKPNRTAEDVPKVRALAKHFYKVLSESSAR